MNKKEVRSVKHHRVNYMMFAAAYGDGHKQINSGALCGSRSFSDQKGCYEEGPA